MAGAVPDPEVRQLYFPCGGLAQVPHPHVLWHSSLYPSSAFLNVYLCIFFQTLFNICWWLCIIFCWWLHLLSDYIQLWQAYLCWFMCCCWWQYIYSFTVHLLTTVHLFVAVLHCLTKYEHLLMAVKCSHWPVFLKIQTFTHSHRPVLLYFHPQSGDSISEKTQSMASISETPVNGQSFRKSRLWPMVRGQYFRKCGLIPQSGSSLSGNLDWSTVWGQLFRKSRLWPMCFESQCVASEIASLTWCQTASLRLWPTQRRRGWKQTTPTSHCGCRVSDASRLAFPLHVVFSLPSFGAHLGVQCDGDLCWV